MSDADAPIAVIGIGNILLGDDGFGPYVVELLRAQWAFPDSVTLLDAGTPGLDLVTYLHGRKVAILIDTVTATGAPGALRLYRNADLAHLAPQARVSPHDPVVHEALQIAALAGDDPQVLLVGVIPLSTELGVGLSDTVRAAAAAASTVVVDELMACGVAPMLRREPMAADAWWIQA